MKAKRRGNLVGERFGRLVVIECLGRQQKYGKNLTIWKCLCDCGNIVEIEMSRLDGKRVRSCGCVLTEFNTTHGMTGTKEYNTWLDMRRRPFDENREDYLLYKDIPFQEEWKTDFMSFYTHIGPCPTPHKEYSIDRIDGNLGYVFGNVRWVKWKVQARNKSLNSNNTTGICGITVYNQNGYKYVRAYATINGKQKSKCFSLNRYKYEEAISLACEWRETMIRSAQEDGTLYSPNHGNKRINHEYTI